MARIDSNSMNANYVGHALEDSKGRYFAGSVRRGEDAGRGDVQGDPGSIWKVVGMESDRRNIGIDILKTLACAGVVSLHFGDSIPGGGMPSLCLCSFLPI